MLRLFLPARAHYKKTKRVEHSSVPCALSSPALAPSTILFFPPMILRYVSLTVSLSLSHVSLPPSPCLFSRTAHLERERAI